MSKNGGERKALADPSKLRPLHKDDEGVIRVVIETPIRFHAMEERLTALPLCYLL